MSEVQAALNDSEKIKNLNIDSPIKSLTYQRELLEVIRSLNTLEENLVKSKIELAKLMGLKPGTQFELSEKIKDKYDLPNIGIPINKLERYALENRPELQETRYQERISEDEVKAVMLKMLPGIDLNAGYSTDNNKYLLNNDWVSYGANVSWNLMSVFNSNLNRKLALTQIELAKQQKLALSMAVISQVHISLLDFEQAKKDYKLSEKYFGVAKEIYKIIQNENSLDVNGNLSLIKEKLNYLISNLRLSSSYAKVQNSYGKIISSVGNEEFFKTTQKTQPVEVSVKSEIKEEAKIVKNATEIKEEKFVEKIEEIQTVTAKEIIGYANGDLNLREKPSLNSNIVDKISNNQKVIILRENFENQDTSRSIDEENEVIILYEDSKNPLWYKAPNGYVYAKNIRTEGSK